MSVRAELDVFRCEEFSAEVHIHEDMPTGRKWAILLLKGETVDIDLFFDSVEAVAQMADKIKTALFVASHKAEEKAE